MTDVLTFSALLGVLITGLEVTATRAMRLQPRVVALIVLCFVAACRVWWWE